MHGRQNIALMTNNSNTKRIGKEGGGILTLQLGPLPGIEQGAPQLIRTLTSLEYLFILPFNYLVHSFDLTANRRRALPLCW